MEEYVVFRGRRDLLVEVEVEVQVLRELRDLLVQMVQLAQQALRVHRDLLEVEVDQDRHAVLVRDAEDWGRFKAKPKPKPKPRTLCLSHLATGFALSPSKACWPLDMCLFNV